MNRTIFLTGILLGTLAIMLGAFGAHGLEKLVDGDAVQIYDTGIKYQMYHAIFLLVLGNFNSLPAQRKKWIFYFIFIGILLFSFSIYLLATNALTSFDFRTIGFLTPVGGIFLIIGWILFGYQGFRYLD